MVQNWENFMMPDSGNNLGDNNALMSGAMGLFFGIGVDWLGTPILNRLEKKELQMSRVGSYRTLKQKMSSIDNSLMSPGNKLRVGMRVKSQVALQRRKNISNIRNSYDTLRGGAKLLGWGLLGMTAASIVEGITTPGLSNEAMQMDAKSIGGGATYLDTPQSYTQRQRALMAIHESQLGIRGIISQEASGFHK